MLRNGQRRNFGYRLGPRSLLAFVYGHCSPSETPIHGTPIEYSSPRESDVPRAHVTTPRLRKRKKVEHPTRATRFITTPARSVGTTSIKVRRVYIWAILVPPPQAMCAGSATVRVDPFVWHNGVVSRLSRSPFTLSCSPLFTPVSGFIPRAVSERAG